MRTINGQMGRWFITLALVGACAEEPKREPPQAVTLDAGVCESSACEPMCDDGCELAGDIRCADGQLQTCDADTRGCLDWSGPTRCEFGFCADNASCGGCEHACIELGSACAADGATLEHCTADSRGCRISSTTDCGAMCVDATCVYGFTKLSPSYQDDTLDTTQDEFGCSVGLSGTLALVGARVDDTLVGAAGAAYVYAVDQGASDPWSPVRKLLAPDGETGDRFGSAVAISGQLVIVGSPANPGMPGPGAAYVFSRDQGGADQWGLVKKLVRPNGESGDSFGEAVAISGGRVVIGAPGVDDLEPTRRRNTGAAYVFARDQDGTDQWGLVTQLLSPERLPNDGFGGAVAIFDDLIVVGAELDDQNGATTYGDVGSAFVFSKDQGGTDSWGMVVKLLAPDGEASDRFGGAVSISGDLIAVGATLEDEVDRDAGSAYVFGRNRGGADSWGLITKILPPDGSPGGYFGWSLAIAADRLLVGGFNDSAHLFERDQGGTDQWGLVTQLSANDGLSHAYFGRSVAIGMDRVLVGALGDNELGGYAGAAFIFEKDEWGIDGWGQSAQSME